MPDVPSLLTLNETIIACQRCDRLIKHCQKVAVDKRAAYRDEDYWGLPVPNFLPAQRADRARLLVVGLAPAAHGANRTGRMFTGDRSGDFLYRAMHAAGFASQPDATGQDDGLELIDAVITAAAHCAPPGNKPTRDELASCAAYLTQTIDLLPRFSVIVCLGKLALDAVLRDFQGRGWIDKFAPYKFGHGVEYQIEPKDAPKDAPKNRAAPLLLCSYHPSQQNTFTGRLTDEMLRKVFERAREVCG